MDDAQIIKLYFDRSEEAISVTGEKYGTLCGRVAYNILNNRQDSEECVNDTWLKAWDSIPPTAPDCLAAYLAKITRNLSITLWRKRGRGGKKLQTELCIEELSECLPDEHTGVSDGFLIRQALDKFLASIKPTARAAFVMRYWYVCTISEIARELSLSEGAVKSQLMRTRKKLKEFFEEEGIEI